MTEGRIQIDSDAVRGLVSTAIVDAISEETRVQVIRDAVQYLITPPPPTGYGQKPPSPLQNAFNVAVSQAAVEVVREMVNEGDLKERIRSMVREQVVDALTNNSPMSEAIGHAVGDVVGKALRGDL